MDHDTTAVSQNEIQIVEALRLTRDLEPSVSPSLESLQSKTIQPPRTSDHVHRQDASILLVGMAGAGKTTLAMIAAFALGRRYINFSTYFEKQLGKSPASYAQEFGIEPYRKSELDLTKSLLQDFSSGHIIEGFSDLGGNAHRVLMKEHAARNPVIYVRREKQELRKFVSSEDGRFDQWHKYRDAFYSSCSSFDFYNLSVPLSDTTATHGHASTLKLKSTEIDFVRFLHRILGKSTQLLCCTDPFSPTYTYALQVPLSWLETSADYEELESGSHAINFIIDVPEGEPDLHDRIARQLAHIRRHSRLPIIFETRCSSQKRSVSWQLINLAFRCLPDMIVIDLHADISQFASLLRMRKDFKKIGAYCLDGAWPISMDDPLCSDLRLKAKSISCDAIRITRTATEQSDNLACTTFASLWTENHKLPIIAYNTSRLGRTSVCLNSILSPTFPLSLASEGVTIQQANSALYSCFIATKKRFAIFGKDVTYSLSPAMHNAAYQDTGMPHRYELLKSDNFLDIHKLLEDEEYAGVAVTLPFKTDAWLLLDQHVSDEAREIGAVNTITILREESTSNSDSPIVLKGHNTDHIGLRECIYRNLSPANLVRATTSALILGAGGMARAALYACQTLGVKNFCIQNRTLRNAEALARSWSSTHPGTRIHVLESLSSTWPAQINQPTIIISTIPAHQSENNYSQDSTVAQSWLQSRTGGVFIELAYNPFTPASNLLKQIRSLSSRGWIAVDGLDVLVEQGIAQFEIFTGRPAPVHVMRRAVRDGWEELVRGAAGGQGMEEGGG